MDNAAEAQPTTTDNNQQSTAFPTEEGSNPLGGHPNDAAKDGTLATADDGPSKATKDTGNNPLHPTKGRTLREVSTLQDPPMTEATSAEMTPVQAPPTQETTTQPPPLANASTPTTHPQQSETMQGANLMPVDRLLHDIYGDHIRADGGIHLNGGVPDDCCWQSYWCRMAQLLPVHYAVPKGKVGQRFLTILTHEFQAVQKARTSNSECPLIFVPIILPKTPGVRMAKDIRLRMQQQMDLWQLGCIATLVDDTESDSLARIGTPPRTRQRDSRTSIQHTSPLWPPMIGSLHPNQSGRRRSPPPGRQLLQIRVTHP